VKNKLESLSKLLETIESTEAEATLDVMNFPYANRPSIEMRVRQSKTALPKLRSDYGREFIKTVTKVIINSDKEGSAQLAKLVSKEGVIAKPANTVYDMLTDFTAPRLDNNVFTTNSFLALMEMMHTTARGFSLRAKAETQAPPPINIEHRSQLHALVKDFVDKFYGPILNELHITNELINQALSDKLNKEVTVLIVPETSNKLDNLLAGQPSLQVELDPGEEVNKSLAMKIYRKVSDSFNKQTIKTNKE
jgi:hypothetical protein